MKKILLVILITASCSQRDLSKYHSKPISYQLRYRYNSGSEAIVKNLININIKLVKQDNLYRLTGADQNSSFSLEWLADSLPVGTHSCSISSDTGDYHYGTPVYQGKVLLTEGPYYAPDTIGTFSYPYSWMTVSYVLNADSLETYFSGYLYNPAVRDSAFLNGYFMIHTAPGFIRPR